MSRKLRIILALTLFVVTIAQLNTKQVTHPPVHAKIEAPDEVLAILERSCFNCHSNETKLAWFDKLIPIACKVKADVDRAREVMNFSEWGMLSVKEQTGKWWGILNMVKSKKMPLKEYVIVHPEAIVTPSEVETIKKYVISTGKEPIDLKDYHNNNDELGAWRRKIGETKIIQQSPNGILYSDDFKKWKVISMSTLYDNSMRIIYGNDIAVKAIEEENFHPWPKGSTVVKVVWEQVENQNDEVRPGKFVNAQFMVKDGDKYEYTEGWGFAKFSGLQLIPTGKIASFASKSCISCHRQLAEETGFLFNVPLKVNRKK